MAYVNESFDNSGETNGFRFLNVGANVIPQTEISLAWQNLRYEVTEWGFLRKPILRRLNGYFETHTLNGLMGPSGAGKTTLLNALSGIAKEGLNDESEIYLHSGQKAPVSYFIEQHVHESIVGQMTVRQILRYAFSFKNGASHSNETIEAYIRDTLQELLLDPRILDRNFENCSGGEQKRVAIAQELMCLQKPDFLFVDEPTTGLDSAAAYEVVHCLKQLTNKYRITVIASIHVPNDETLSLFDKLYVLAKGGVCIYSGPPSTIESHLRKVEVQIPSDQPPIESLIKIACTGTQSSTVAKLANQCLTDQHHAIAYHQPDLSRQPNGLPNRRKHLSVLDFAIQTARLARITFISKYRSFLFTYALMFVFFGVMVSLFNRQMATASSCYAKNKTHSNATCLSNIEEDLLIRENVNYLTYVLLYTGLIMSCTSALLYSSFVKVFRNEHRNYWYSLGIFYWASMLISLLEMTLYVFFNSSLGYFLPGMHAIDDYALNWNRFGLYFLFMWLCCLYMQSFGQLIGLILVDHMEFAIIACLIQNAALTLVNGMFVDMARNSNQLIMDTSSVMAFKYVAYGVLYTFYGFQRCDEETEHSIISQFFRLDQTDVREYVARVMVNVVVLRLASMLIMYLKFGNLPDNPLFRLFKKCKDEHSIRTRAELIEIDYDKSEGIDDVDNNNQEKVVLKVPLKRANNEVEFDQFSRGKVLIGWRNLCLYGQSSIYEMGSTKVSRRSPILRNLNGQFRFGTLNALMGTSGAGKTSLLKVLNGQCKTRLSDSTQIYLSKFTKITTCFITQEVSGHLMPGLTAKQMLVYASRLKNANENVDHDQIALNVLDELGLNEIVDTKVERCSGGERKRLALALELTSLQMPNLICIDEPTSGLDSNSAEIVISCLRKLTQNHSITIVTSIHQPTTEVLYMFDQLYVLARGGVCIYSGAPQQIKSHLGAIPEIDQTDSKYAIETLIKQSCLNHDQPPVQQLAAHNDAQWNTTQNADLARDTQLVLDGVQRNRQRFSLAAAYILLCRYLAYFRGHLWLESIFFAFNYLIYGFALRLVYEKAMIYIDGCMNLQEDDTSMCRRTEENVEVIYQLLNNFKFNFFYANFFLFFVVFQFAMSMLKELKYLTNEHRNGWYSSGSFYLMKSLFEIVPLIPIVMFYVYICNWYEELRPGIYWQFVQLFILGAIAFQGMAHTFALLSKGNITVLIMLSVTVFLFFTLLSNFLLTYARLHYIYQFISNFAISRFIFEAVMLLIYGFGRCAPNEIQQLLYIISIRDDDYYHCIQMLVFNIIVYRLIAIYLLMSKVNPVENRRQRVERIKDYIDSLQPSKTPIPGMGNNSQQFCVKVKVAETV